ncbi:MAG: DUF4058 family protein [Planctomycetia bacterium]|nr:DUF4058 family protein [Planctomycetia bacterium]
MPMHDWTKVEAGIFHAFHHRWITAISDTLNAGVLPPYMYAMPEQVAGGFGPDVLTLQEPDDDPDETPGSGGAATTTRILQPRPVSKITAQTEAEFYRRKKSAIAIRHVSGDRVVAMIEIVSPGNKASKNAVRAVVNKACELLEARIHLLIVDPFPPGPRDPGGVHGLIWDEVTDTEFRPPTDKPLTLVAYESDLITRAYVETIAVGDKLPDMPLFLEPDGCIWVPLETTYTTAFEVQPRRWREVLQPPSGNL